MKKSIKNIVKIFFLLLIINQVSFAKDPLNSSFWNETIKQMIGDDKYIFDDKNIKINVPSFADNPLQVPIFIDATKIKKATRLLVFADINAIVKVADYHLGQMKAILSLNIKVAQGTPLRAAVLDEDGLWHIGSANINSFGGGCSVASEASQMESFEDLLGKTKSKVWKKDNTYRIKWSIFHPMETGLFVGNPSFYISEVDIKIDSQTIGKIDLYGSVSENPRITLETKAGLGAYKLFITDTDGNKFEVKTKI
ncbi:quinoprotein dehydrogenase-associated SoxYZ-like carrier [Poseidonibacter lekithochrous]|uniref:quinoprotein dehydrogenase-associated SoxYZ-like carrier n=1 Tax=Poseidonibacter TaxID=2321187 RepID=UPI001C0A2468|nr:MULTISPECIES: quinoprotein dehydrogenase-associated SoxYZ-like carrier [Poseidonibacter]MBU3014154.1 quinoprotein dehydrogenase-associated SoxYZ-like carrier [Poseidonibacter lekithochrous]MDO6827452.1 quinoprotein dehydrogenase-associated SoxYZ-like carrier [Poseidonibacter sp. 1_MG-2023]